MMRNILLFCLTFSIASCSSFSEISNATKFEKVDGYIKVYNLPAGVQSFTFGDFKFAVNRTQFKELNESKPDFNDIILYAKTMDVPYEYYLIYNPKKLAPKDKFLYKDTLIENSRFVLAISKNAPESDIKFIMDNLSSYK